ncbi:unnamed protein product [Eruca vesicaria subsp. sativa]|uniref:CMP/dCMP-type deaminase domain-containing protein n=1 Tax=Eruca vesicaria subsp. sativa TaxID=29727 RepID=A0ABC8K7A6_ERUVS|nr:unnamed protein product [Eruca vesicaria subsp. sativa]
MAEPFQFVRDKGVDAFSRSNIPSMIMEARPMARSLTSKPLPHIAIGRGSSGQIYLGFDVDLPELPPNFSIDAVQFLVVNLMLNQEPKLLALAISDNGTRYYAPCGHFCQFLQEIHNGDYVETLITGPTGLSDFIPLDKLLPQRFSPYGAIQEDIHADVLLMRNNRLNLIDNTYCLLKDTALKAANRSYAPYSNAPSGVVLFDSSKRLHIGSYIESVASVPSLGPVQAALANFVIHTGGRQFKNIIRAVLVETRSSFRQEGTARLILQTIAPTCDFRVYHCSNGKDPLNNWVYHCSHCEDPPNN